MAGLCAGVHHMCLIFEVSSRRFRHWTGLPGGGGNLSEERWELSLRRKKLAVAGRLVWDSDIDTLRGLLV